MNQTMELAKLHAAHARRECLPEICPFCEHAPVVINMNERWVDCIACGAPTLPEQGLPMYEGEFVPNDWEGEWGGFTACRTCYTIHKRGGPVALNAHLAALDAAAPLS